jgi:hypothetical protein
MLGAQHEAAYVGTPESCFTFSLLLSAQYWLVTYLWFYQVYAVYILIFCIFGAIVRLKVFSMTSGGIQVRASSRVANANCT